MTDDVTENENIVDETIDNTSETDNNDLMNSEGVESGIEDSVDNILGDMFEKIERREKFN